MSWESKVLDMLISGNIDSIRHKSGESLGGEKVIVELVGRAINAEFLDWTLTAAGKQSVCRTSIGRILKMSDGLGNSMCSFLTCAKLAASLLSAREAAQVAMATLLRNVGEHACAKICSSKACLFRNSLSGGLIAKWYSPGSGFGKNDWDTVVRIAAVNADHTTPNVMRQSLLGSERQIVQTGVRLVCRATGVGKFGTVAFPIFDLVKFREKYGYISTVIQISGPSASGKSTLAKNITRQFAVHGKKNAVITVARDVVMSDAVEIFSGLEPTGSVLTGRDYDDTRRLYKEKGLRDEVNKLMKERIEAGIVGGKVVIVDTASVMEGSLNWLYPNVVSRCFKVAIDMIRTKPIGNDGRRVGIGKEHQLRLFGETNDLCWVSAFVKPEHLHQFAPMETVPSPDPYERVRPHLRFQLTWKLNNPIGFAKLLKQIIESAK